MSIQFIPMFYRSIPYPKPNQLDAKMVVKPVCSRFPFVFFLLLGVCTTAQGQWHALSLPALQTIPFVDDAKTYKDTIYINGGDFRSTDGGHSWTTFLNVRLFELNRHTGHLYAIDTTNNLIESTDSGVSWQLTGPSSLVKDAPNVAIGDLQAGGLSQDVLLGRNGYTVYKWVPNEGWETLNQPDTIMVTSMRMEGDDVWMGTMTVPYHLNSTNPVFTPLDFPALVPAANQQYVQTSGDTVLIAYATDPDGSFYNIARSTDNGAQWSIDSTSFNTLNNGLSFNLSKASLPFVVNSLDGTYISYTGWKDWQKISHLRFNTAFRRSDASLLFPYPVGGLLRYFNGTMDYEPSDWDTPAVSAPQAFPPRFLGPYLIWGQSPVEMAYSGDLGETWETRQQPWPHQGTVEWGNQYIGLSTRSLFSTPADGSFNWEEPYLFYKSDGRIICTSGNSAYAIFNSGEFLRTIDGLAWATTGYKNQPPYGPFQEIDFAAAAGKLFYSRPVAPGFNPPAGLWTSSDHGANWSILPGFEDFSINSGRVYGVDEYLFVSDGANKSIQRSADGGSTFQTLNVPSDSNGTVFRLRINNKKLYLYLGNDVLYLSPDRGDSWQLIPAPFPGFFEVGIDFSKPTSISATDSAILINHKTLGPYLLDLRQITQRIGRVFWDINQNGLPDAGEPGVGGAVLRTSISETYSHSDDLGFFTAFPSINGDTVRVTGNFPHFEVQPGYLITGTSGTDTLYFALHKTEDVRDVQLHVAQSAVFNPGFENKLTLTILNIGSESSDGTLKLVLHPAVNVLAALPLPTGTSGDTLQWDYSALLPFQKIQFSVELLTIGVPIGTDIMIPVWVTTPDDINPGDNTVLINEKVVGSYDPNDKRVEPAVWKPESSKKGAPLTYTIRFQNTGTFPTAFVVLRDTLAPELNVASIRLIASSHPCSWRILGANVIEFYFPTLALPPAQSDEAGSHGFVQFSVATARDLQLNETVRNRANIYFDYNPPIVTNYAETRVKRNDLTDPGRLEYKVLPNPVSGDLFIQWTAYPEGSLNAQLIGSNGQVCAEKTLVPESGIQQVFNVSGVQNGVYTIRVFATNGVENSVRVVIMN